MHLIYKWFNDQLSKFFNVSLRATICQLLRILLLKKKIDIMNFLGFLFLSEFIENYGYTNHFKF